MKVITGKYRGKKLIAPDGLNTRPTLQRAKETMFNMSPQWFEGRALDVFSGTGQLGIEILSRGCSKCVFNEFNKDSLKILRSNLENVPFEEYEILSLDYKKLMERVKDDEFSVILIDPPYPIAQESLEYILKFIDENNMLTKGGMITGEIPANLSLGDNYNNFYQKKFKEFSKITSIWQYRGNK